MMNFFKILIISLVFIFAGCSHNSTTTVILDRNIASQTSLTDKPKFNIGPEVIKAAIKSSELKSLKSALNEAGKVFVIKVIHKSLLTNQWAETLCLKTAETLADVYGYKSQTHCFLDNGINHEEVMAHVASTSNKLNADFELDLSREMDGIKIALINLKQPDKNVTNKVGWKIANTGEMQFQDNLKERLIASYFAMNNLNVIRDVLVDLIYKSYNPKFQKNDSMSREDLYSDLQASGLWTSKSRKFLTAGSELLATLSFGWYGYNYLTTNQPDFDYQQEGFIKTIENKFTFGSMLRYDDNSWNVNKNHIFAGVTYYLECRGVGLTALESYMCSIAGSLAWESVVEWREVLSINDSIFTSHGGAILGESIHQLGKYIDQKSPKWFRNSIGWVWRGPKKAIRIYNSKALDGMDSDIESEDPLVSGKFEFEVGTLKLSNGVSEKRVGVNNEVITIPFMVEPGHEVKFIKDIVESDFNFSAPNESILREYDLFAKVVMAAYYNKNISIDKNSVLNGYSFYIGPSAAIDIKNDYNSRDDFIGIVHVLGGSAKLINFYKGFKITSTLDFWGDSVMMKSMLVEKYEAANPGAELIGNLTRSDYYHGFGYTSKGQIILEYGNASFGASFSYGNSANTNQRQRDLGKILTQINISRVNLDTEFFVERKITKNLKVKFAVEVSKRSDNISGFGSGDKTIVTRKVFLTYYF